MTKGKVAWYGSIIGIIAALLGILGGLYAGTQVIEQKIEKQICMTADSLDKVRDMKNGERFEYIKCVLANHVSREELRLADEDYTRWKKGGGK